MRLATWNVNGLRARLEFVLHWLDERRPDVVGLQELKLAAEHFPHERFAAAGYQAVVCGQKAWNGVAILSRGPLELATRGLPGQEELGARLVRARAGELDFWTVYCPNGKGVRHPDFVRKLAWFDDLAAFFAGEAEGGRTVLCGDFNVCPGPLDTWHGGDVSGRVFHTVEERRRFSALTEGGLVDLFRHRHPERQAFSWWDYRAGSFHKNEGLRIDFVLASEEIAARLAAAEIDREFRKKQRGLTASDHAPVWVDVD